MFLDSGPMEHADASLTAGPNGIEVSNVVVACRRMQEQSKRQNLGVS